DQIQRRWRLSGLWDSIFCLLFENGMFGIQYKTYSATWISLAHHEIYTGYVPMDYRECLKKMPMNGEWGYHVMLQAATDLLQGWRRHSGLEMAGEAELPCATLSTKVMLAPIHGLVC
uniref:Uncharacterized protein n=1 Tax=Aegilops tauschii subsp. strangulata TaxID=200361 RepID=A0A452ZZ50_AEGTS